MKKIVVVGLGPGGMGQLTAAAWSALQMGRPLYFRTGSHAVARRLRRLGFPVQAFDHLFLQERSFEGIGRAIALRLLGAAERKQTVIYAVPGHPAVGDATVKQIFRLAPRYGVALQMIPGIGLLEPVQAALQIDLSRGVKIMDILELASLQEPLRTHLLLTHVSGRCVALRVKERLLQFYQPSHPVKIIRFAGRRGAWVHTVALDKLERSIFGGGIILCLPPAVDYGFDDLVEIMARLRSKGGCPWDREQTHRSLRQYLVEEAYEVVAAIDRNDDLALQEELGDLLLQIVFHSQIAREEGRFTLQQVIDGIAAKLVRRHPHVFGSENITGVPQVLDRWEQIKGKEKGIDSPYQITVDPALPALLRAFKIQKRAADLGFDWPTADGALAKLNEEALELADAYRDGLPGKIEEEYGDYLFAAVNVARFLRVNPEMALGKAIRKFLSRFHYIVEQMEQKGKPFLDYSLEELDQWWEEAKSKGK